MIATSGEQATRRFRVLLVLRTIKKDPWPLSKNVPPTGKENKTKTFSIKMDSIFLTLVALERSGA